MTGVAWRWGFWVRLPHQGWGISVARRRKRDALWTERHGLRIVRYALGLRFELLRPTQPPIS